MGMWIIPTSSFPFVFHCWLHSYVMWCSLGLHLKNIRLQPWPRPDLQSQIRPRSDFKKSNPVQPYNRLKYKHTLKRHLLTSTHATIWRLGDLHLLGINFLNSGVILMDAAPDVPNNSCRSQWEVNQVCPGESLSHESRLLQKTNLL